jgi:hypothetical protein
MASLTGGDATDVLTKAADTAPSTDTTKGIHTFPSNNTTASTDAAEGADTTVRTDTTPSSDGKRPRDKLSSPRAHRDHSGTSRRQPTG